jgi:hypothetical protein
MSTTSGFEAVMSHSTSLQSLNVPVQIIVPDESMSSRRPSRLLALSSNMTTRIFMPSKLHCDFESENQLIPMVQSCSVSVMMHPALGCVSMVISAFISEARVLHASKAVAAQQVVLAIDVRGVETDAIVFDMYTMSRSSS